jgi:hypothetical protein
MANLTLVYGLRLLPSEELAAVSDATLTLKNGNEAHCTMHVLEGSREQIEAQLKLSIDAFFVRPQRAKSAPRSLESASFEAPAASMVFRRSYALRSRKPQWFSTTFPMVKTRAATGKTR